MFFLKRNYYISAKYRYKDELFLKEFSPFLKENLIIFQNFFSSRHLNLN